MDATATDTAPRTWRGADLRLLRLGKRVTATAVARAMGVSRQRVNTIEATDLPPFRTVARYLEALARAERER